MEFGACCSSPLVSGGIYADTLVLVDTDFKNYIPQDLPPLVDFRHMTDIFGGTDTIELLIQADDVTDPKTLKWMDEFTSYLMNSRNQIYGYRASQLCEAGK